MGTGRRASRRPPASHHPHADSGYARHHRADRGAGQPAGKRVHPPGNGGKPRYPGLDRRAGAPGKRGRTTGRRQSPGAGNRCSDLRAALDLVPAHT
ncbi:hypothetical protein G6F57_022301 [Rhizopus arrhizus]|nr:hypothetical protein G6F57_022301 [Rhizopus arrhizus]